MPIIKQAVTKNIRPDGWKNVIEAINLVIDLASRHESDLFNMICNHTENLRAYLSWYVFKFNTIDEREQLEKYINIHLKSKEYYSLMLKYKKQLSDACAISDTAALSLTNTTLENFYAIVDAVETSYAKYHLNYIILLRDKIIKSDKVLKNLYDSSNSINIKVAQWNLLDIASSALEYLDITSLFVGRLMDQGISYTNTEHTDVILQRYNLRTVAKKVMQENLNHIIS